MPRVLLNLGVMIATSGLVFASPTPPASGQPSIDDALSMLEQKAWPFGRVGPADEDRLQEFALTRGFDLKAAMARVYCCEKKIDEDALMRVFMFSRQFNTLDKNARTYGQIIYSSSLRIGEVLGIDYYVSIINRQPTDVQQRVRDFLYYPMLTVRKEQRHQVEEENSKMYPTLFPKSFQFGRDDPIFAKET